MAMMTHRSCFLAAAAAVSAVLSAPAAVAAPMDPRPLSITDSDGNSHQILLHGDEFITWASDQEGYPVERGEDGNFRYISVAPDGSWITTPYKLDSTSPKALGLTPWPQLDPSHAARGQALRKKFRNSSRASESSVNPRPPSGKLHAIVVPMSFPDVKLTRSKAEIQELFDGPVRNYYREVSGGLLDLTATVMDPLTMKDHNAAYYAWNSKYPARPAWYMYDAAFDYLNEVKKLDFTPFDANNDGYADLFIIVHAGKGREQTGDDSDMHSHFMPMANLSGYPDFYTSHDGIKFFGYVTVPENSKLNDITPLGVIVHESGHYFGLPDLYHTGTSSKGQGLGEFCLMSSGMWLGPTAGASPSHLSAWCKAQLGWKTPETIREDSQIILQPVQIQEGKILRINTDDDAADEKQYFLLENRQKSGFDSYIPGSGLLIYHVDEGVFPDQNSSSRFLFNQFPDHYSIDLEQADGLRELNTTNRRGDADDPFPTAENSDFTSTTTPSSLAYGATRGNVAVSSIRRSTASASIFFDVTLSPPLANGEDCTSDALCESGICSPICCDTACDGACGRICASQRAECEKPEGIACDDGDACTDNDMCRAGLCTGTPRDCGGADSCVISAFCDPLSGQCFSSTAADGTSCSLNDALEGDDFCMGGRIGTCESGVCRLPVHMDGQSCDDGNACTVGDTCSSGRCAPGSNKICSPPDECHLAGTCDPATGTCSVVPAFEGTACSGGTCQEGVCVKEKGSGCSASGSASHAPPILAILAAALLMRHKRRRAAPRRDF